MTNDNRFNDRFNTPDEEGYRAERIKQFVIEDGLDHLDREGMVRSLNAALAAQGSIPSRERTLGQMAHLGLVLANAEPDILAEAWAGLSPHYQRRLLDALANMERRHDAMRCNLDAADILARVQEVDG